MNFLLIDIAANRNSNRPTGWGDRMLVFGTILVEREREMGRHI
jgi:hypothetical protein